MKVSSQLQSFVALFIVETALCLTVVDLLSPGATELQTRVAVQVCAGLFNRNPESAGAAYVILDDRDRDWLADIDGINDTAPYEIPAEDFVRRCLADGRIAKGYINYNATQQALVMPNLITMAAVLDAVPLERGQMPQNNASLVFDAVAEWEGFSPLNATSWTYARYGFATSSMAKMNPGYDQHAAARHPVHPPLTGTINPGLVDYIVKERLFNFYLLTGCIPGTDEYALVARMVNDTAGGNNWPRPIPVWGYDDTFPVAGDLFEAETDCNREHNMGQIASSGVNNLAYFSMGPQQSVPAHGKTTVAQGHPRWHSPPRAPTPLPALHREEEEGTEREHATHRPRPRQYVPSHTYVAVIIGDGDNLAFVKGSRRDWMLERSDRCALGSGADDPSLDCFPLVWSLSPRLATAAPGMLQWYYEQAQANRGADSFALPPSGHLYAYPGMMPDEAQAAFAERTERDCVTLNTSAVVHWEWFGTWERAIEHFMPRYCKGDGKSTPVVRSLIPVNVPFFLPMPEGHFPPGEHYRMIEDDRNSDDRNGDDRSDGGCGGVILFKPREWRGTACAPAWSCPTAAELAAELSSARMVGSVSAVYVTSDGGADLGDVYDMVAALEDHVEIVDEAALADLALAREAARRRRRRRPSSFATTTTNKSPSQQEAARDERKGAGARGGERRAQLRPVAPHSDERRRNQSVEGSPIVPYDRWAALVKAGHCGRDAAERDRLRRLNIKCTTHAASSLPNAPHLPASMRRTTTTRFDFPPGVFEMAEQLLVPEGVHIAGAADPNDWSNPASAPDYSTQTLFLATRGATSYDAPYCFADDMVTTRVGFVLSSFVTVERVSYQGLDTIRPADNGALCGGGAFETKGCALNDCSNTVNNGGSDGMASVNVTIRDVRVNDFYYDDDAPLIGASVDGNYNCSEYGGTNCCFCLPNGVRSTQVAVWVPLARSNGSSATAAGATRNLVVENLVSRSTQADGVNLHGLVRDAVVANVRIESTGDDAFAVWGGDQPAAGLRFTRGCVAVNPGVLRPNWYGNCVATYGLGDVSFEGMTCLAPTLIDPIPDPQKPDSSERWRIDTSMFVFWSSFWAEYPDGNSIEIRGWNFTNLHGDEYTSENGTMNAPAVDWEGKMVWTNSSQTGVIAPYYIPTDSASADDGGIPDVFAYASQGMGRKEGL